MSYEKQQIGPHVLYRGDCLEVLPTLGKVDAVVTDPPYGVMLGKKANNQRFDRMQYESFDDTPENVQIVCVPAVKLALEKSARGLVTPGVKNMWLYPKPSHVGAAYYPCATGCNSWGFSNWQPLFYYGKDPFGGKGSLHDSFRSTEPSEKNGHPCPKPIGQMQWMVKRVSVPNETIIDPFMGSGTTGVACVNLGRKFIGIELEPKYFDIACKRIEKAISDQRLLDMMEQPQDSLAQAELFAATT